MLAELLYLAGGALFGTSAVLFAADLHLTRERDAHRTETAALRKQAGDTRRERDAALDALHGLADAVQTGHGVDGALDAARWVLNSNDYAGELRGARAALQEAVQELDALRAGVVVVDEHADIVAILHTTADRVEPAYGLDRIHARIQDHTC